jgi:hypothetical protein
MSRSIQSTGNNGEWHYVSGRGRRKGRTQVRHRDHSPSPQKGSHQQLSSQEREEWHDSQNRYSILSGLGGDTFEIGRKAQKKSSKKQVRVEQQKSSQVEQQTIHEERPMTEDRESLQTDLSDKTQQQQELADSTQELIGTTKVEPPAKQERVEQTSSKQQTNPPSPDSNQSWGIFTPIKWVVDCIKGFVSWIFSLFSGKSEKQ